MRRTRLDILRQMRSILSDPKKWGKGYSYYNGKFCISGAFCQAKYGTPYLYLARAPELHGLGRARSRERDKFAKLMGFKSGDDMVRFNDSGFTKHKDIIKAINRGINKLKRIRAKRSGK